MNDAQHNENAESDPIQRICESISAGNGACRDQTPYSENWCAPCRAWKAYQDEQKNGRRARCHYYGSSNQWAIDAKRTDVRCGTPDAPTICRCERPSKTRDGERPLALFDPRPNEAFDRYFCGCFGWD